MLQPEKVLILENSSTITSYMAAALSSAGYIVMTARDGNEGLQRVSRYKPRCLVLDLVLPDMNGFELCRRLRKNDPRHHCRIILIGNRNTSLEYEWSWRQGADCYLPMPFSQEALVQAVRHVLSPAFHLPTTPQQLASAPPPRPQPAQSSRLLDWNTLIPHRTEEPELMVSSNPFASSVVITDRRLRSVYNAIDNQKSIKQLCHVTGLSVKDLLSALQALAQRGRIELYEADGTLVDSTQLFSN